MTETDWAEGIIADRREREARELAGAPLPELPLAAELLDTGAPCTGVIVGVDASTTAEAAARIREQLDERFPGVTFAIVAGAQSVAFTWWPEGSLQPE